MPMLFQFALFEPHKYLKIVRCYLGYYKQ